MKAFLKTTIVGGILFLLPVALVLLILGHALRAALKVARPISSELHLDQLGAAAGIGVATILAVLILIIVSFIAGLVSRTRMGGDIARWFEDSLVGAMPPYRMVKTMAKGFTQIEESETLRPVLVSIEDGWQIGYLLEPIGDGWVAVFLPQAPTPMSGNVMYFPSERVRPLDISMAKAMAVVKRMGMGSGELLQGVDLTGPAEAEQAKPGARVKVPQAAAPP